MPQSAVKTRGLYTSVVGIWNRFFAVHLNGFQFLPAANGRTTLALALSSAFMAVRVSK